MSASWRGVVNIVCPKLVGCSSLSQVRSIIWSGLHRRGGKTFSTALAEWPNAG
jgi:hypothetical protein